MLDTTKQKKTWLILAALIGVACPDLSFAAQPAAVPAPPTPATPAATTQPAAPQIAPKVTGAAQTIYNTEPTDGPTYLKNVMLATESFGHNEDLAAFASAALIPTKPDSDYAAVCLQKTEKGVFRVHSQNPAALGLVTSQTDITAFSSLFKLEKGATFNYNLPANIDGSGAPITYYGQLFLKHGDGKASGDVVCFARYK
jgi:hypothetical protein